MLLESHADRSQVRLRDRRINRPLRKHLVNGRGENGTGSDSGPRDPTRRARSPGLRLCTAPGVAARPKSTCGGAAHNSDLISVAPSGSVRGPLQRSCLSLLVLRGELLPEVGDVNDRNSLDLAEAQQIGVGADDVVGFAGYGTFEELVIGRITTHADRDLGTDEHCPPPDSNQDGTGFTGRHSELSQHFRARSYFVEFGKDRLGSEQDELAAAPRLIDASREAPRAGEPAPQEDLSIKNDFERGQPAPLRR